MDGPFSHLGGINYEIRCQGCQRITVIDNTTGKFADLSRFPDGFFRMTELLDLNGVTKLSYHFVIDGVPTKEQLTRLSADHLNSGVVSIREECTSGGKPSCKRIP